MSQTPEGYRASGLYYRTYIINEVILHPFNELTGRC